MKKILILLTFTLFLASNASCFPQKEYKTDKGPFTTLPFLNPTFASIDKPKLAWIFTWGKQGSESPMEGMQSSPIIDGDGNAYFYHWQEKMISVSYAGRLQWKMYDSLGKVQSLNYGIITNINLSHFIEKIGGVILGDNGAQRFVFDSYPYLGPDGFFYSYFQKKDDKRIARDALMRQWDFRYDRITHLYSFDANQKIRWIYAIPKIGDEYLTLEKCFFDEKGNIYFILTVQMSKDRRYSSNDFVEIYSLTHEGKLRWKKEFSQVNEQSDIFSNHFIDFIPDPIQIKDIFLIRISDYTGYQSDKSKDINKIVCLSTMGQEIWSLPIPKDLSLLNPYSVSKDSNFYVTLTNWELENSYLLVISKNGKKIWTKELTGEKATPPILDKDGNIYIGVGSGYYGKKYSDRYLYSFTPNGQLRWKMLQLNPSQNFEHSLVFGPDRRIYYGCSGLNVLYCIENE